MKPELLRQANLKAVGAITAADPVLTDIGAAYSVIPGFTRNTILTSGPTMPWKDYVGGQRDAVIGGALFEGMAKTAEQADAMIANEEIQVRGCQELGCVGSLAGIYTASMPVFVVRNSLTGRVAFCNFFEGKNPRRLNYGVYDDQVRLQLELRRGAAGCSVIASCDHAAAVQLSVPFECARFGIMAHLGREKAPFPRGHWFHFSDFAIEAAADENR